MAKNDHLNYFELVYYGKDCQNGLKYSKYNRKAEKNVDREIRICNKCDKVYEIYNVGQRKYVQFNYENFPRIGKNKEKCAICRRSDGEKVYLSVDLVLDIKRELFGTKRKLNDLENWELGKLINVLRNEYARRKKLHKRNNNKRKKL